MSPKKLKSSKNSEKVTKIKLSIFCQQNDDKVDATLAADTLHFFFIFLIEKAETSGCKKKAIAQRARFYAIFYSFVDFTPGRLHYKKLCREKCTLPNFPNGKTETLKRDKKTSGKFVIK